MELPDPRIGLEFGDYKIVRKIAEGGMGAVYLAEHAGMYKVVKFMLGEAMKIPAIRNRFITECHAAKRFKGHSGIVAIDSFGERNGELYLVMEYIDGITLEEHIRRNVRLTEHHTFHIMVLCLRALSLLHAEGIIHRDLKPSNIFLRDTDERPWDPTLIDFGIVHDSKKATTAEFGTREGQMIGTPGFMATEQFGGAHKVTPATDVFACAVMMWLMLTGDLPWGVAENEYAQYDRQLNHRPVWPAHIPLPYAEGWKELLVEALSPDPARRPATAQLFALLLAQRLEPIPPHVPSGLDMIGKLAPKFLQNLPAELETVRQPNGRIEVAAFWSPRAAASAPGRMTPSGVDLGSIRVSAVMQAQQIASAPTVSARPQPAGAPVGGPMTTLSAASGVASAQSFPSSPTTSSSRLRLAALGIGAAVVIGGATFGVSRLRSHPATTPAVEPATTPNAPVVTPSAPVPPADADGSGAPIATHSAAARDLSGSSEAVGSATPTPVVPPVSHAAANTEGSDAAPTTSSAKSSAAAAAVSAAAPGAGHPSATSKASGSATTKPGTSRATSSAVKPSASHTSSASPPTSAAGTRSGSATFDPDAIKE